MERRILMILYITFKDFDILLILPHFGISDHSSFRSQPVVQQGSSNCRLGVLIAHKQQKLCVETMVRGTLRWLIYLLALVALKHLYDFMCRDDRGGKHGVTTHNYRLVSDHGVTARVLYRAEGDQGNRGRQMTYNWLM